MTLTQRQRLSIAAVLALLLVATRGSHVGSAAMLPDATLAVMLLGGMMLRSGAWFATLMACAAVVDAFAVGVVGVSSYCLSPAYWALLPTYGVMWLAGAWLSRRGNAFAALPYVLASFVATSIAFAISTHSFYLFSGRFPQASVWEVLQHGWEYYPAYVGYTLMYLAAAWLLRQLWPAVATARTPRSA